MKSSICGERAGIVQARREDADNARWPLGVLGPGHGGTAIRAESPPVRAAAFARFQVILRGAASQLERIRWNQDAADEAAPAAAATGLLGALLTPLLALLGTWAGYRMSPDSSQSSRERQFVQSFYRKLAGCILGFFVAYGLLMVFAQDLIATHAQLLTALILGMVIAYTIATVWLTIWSTRIRRTLLGLASTENRAASDGKPAWEYRSEASLFGLPPRPPALFCLARVP